MTATAPRLGPEVRVTCVDDEPDFTARVELDYRWNGWAVPYFDRENTQKILDWNASIADLVSSRLEWGPDDTVIETYEDEPDEQWPIEPVTDDLGVLRWSIGGCAWTWWERHAPEDEVE